MNPEPAPPAAPAAGANSGAPTLLPVLANLADTAEARLGERGHARRVGELAARLAFRLGLPRHEVELLRLAAPLHDVGILGVPDAILLKPGPLSGDEYEQVKRHVPIGVAMLSHGDSALLEMARTVVRTHHERFDGSGYPDGLARSAIPIAGQITAVVDVFDSLTRKRPHRRAHSAEEAATILRSRSGTEFNPRLVTAFMRVLREAQPSPPPPGESDLRLAGRVDVDTLLGLLTSLEHNNRSSRLQLYLDFSEATLLLRRGRLVHAEYEGLTGDAAVVRVFAKAQRLGAADLLLEPWRPAVEDAVGGGETTVATVVTPMQALLLEAAVALDEELERREGGRALRGAA